MSQLAFGGLTINGGVGTVAVSAAAALMTGWLNKAADNASDADGDFSIVPDLANNRILLQAPNFGSGGNAPAGKTPTVQKHTYHVFFDLQGTTTGAQPVSAQIRKFASTASGLVADLIWKGQFNITTGVISGQGILALSQADLVAAQAAALNQPAFADPTAPDAQHPYFTGQGGAPKNMVGIDVVLIAGGADTLTIVNAHLTVYRLR